MFAATWCFQLQRNSSGLLAIHCDPSFCYANGPGGVRTGASSLVGRHMLACVFERRETALTRPLLSNGPYGYLTMSGSLDGGVSRNNRVLSIFQEYGLISHVKTSERR